MELSPRLYHWLVRPEWFTKLYLNRVLSQLFKGMDLENKSVLDFGCGIGTNSSLFSPKYYLGIDCDHNRVSYARLLHKDYNFMTINDLPLPIKNGSLDYIFIMAVLHHMNPNIINHYLLEFHRALKPGGKVLVIEPCYSETNPLNNWCMKTLDKGKYLCNQEGYLSYFKEQYFETQVIKQFKKCLFYNELFFIASPN